MSTADAFPILKGDRIRLNHMPNDPDPIPPGTTGTVLAVSQGLRPGELHVTADWDIDRSLSPIWPVDHFTIIRKENDR